MKNVGAPGQFSLGSSQVGTVRSVWGWSNARPLWAGHPRWHLGLAADTGCQPGAPLGRGQLECQDMASPLCGVGFLQHGHLGPRASILRARFQDIKVEAARLLMTSLQKSHSVTLSQSVGHTGLSWIRCGRGLLGSTNSGVGGPLGVIFEA